VASSLVSSPLASQASTVSTARIRRLAERTLALWHLTSLDAPTVAVVWALAIARAAHVHLEPWIPTLLATGTWTAYVLDRLLDSRCAVKNQNAAVLRERHYFHWRHRRTLLPLATCTAGVAAALIIKLMPDAAREHDSIIAAAALAYFSGVHSPAQFPRWTRRIASKELLVGMLFAAGCAAPTLTRLRSIAPAWPVVITVCFLALLAWLNCTAISMWESHSNFSNIPAIAPALALSGLAIAMVSAPGFAGTSALLMAGALSALLLFALHRSRGRLDPITVRALADLVLLVPAVLLIPGVVGA